MQQRIGLGSEDSPSFWAIQHLPGEQGKRMPLYNATVQPTDITFFCFFSLALSLSLFVSPAVGVHLSSHLKPLFRFALEEKCIGAWSCGGLSGFATLLASQKAPRWLHETLNFCEETGLLKENIIFVRTVDGSKPQPQATLAISSALLPGCACRSVEATGKGRRL